MAEFLNEKGYRLGINGIDIVNDDGTIRYSLPEADGTENQYLTTDGSGIFSFKNLPSSAGGTGTGTEYRFGSSPGCVWPSAPSPLRCAP